MEYEEIGDCGGGNWPGDSKWILYCYEAGMNYLTHVVGAPPEGCEFIVRWINTDYGEVPAGIALTYGEDSYLTETPPWSYITMCEKALEIFNTSVEWNRIKPSEIGKKVGIYMGEDMIEVEEEEE